MQFKLINNVFFVYCIHVKKLVYLLGGKNLKDMHNKQQTSGCTEVDMSFKKNKLRTTV